ncbi:hypothetical protein [Pseudoalteromonas rubra]|uniref:hypothetical protein n=1 Tax=Pseudoalteromonas rubra TaxID=43658 RepID=UPI002DBD5A05|nr:hypothetical protein [Pseudoalteromonas rubra]MEC4091598.1 hypothetical protein [Pseudoalteromonas rubra]
MAKKKALSDECQAQIRNLYDEKVSAWHASRQLGLTHSQVRYYYGKYDDLKETKQGEIWRWLLGRSLPPKGLDPG